MNPTDDDLTAAALALLRRPDGDRYQVVELLARHDPDVVSTVYLSLQGRLIWPEPDVSHFVAISEAGIHHALTASALATDAALSRSFRGNAQVLAFSLASQTWPGWDRAAYALGSADIAAGREAARLARRLADELFHRADGRANARWPVGAHEMAAGAFDAAAATFRDAAILARLGQHPPTVLMLEGYACLAAALAQPEDPDCQRRFLEAVATVQRDGNEGAISCAAQLTTAHRLFSRPSIPLGPPASLWGA